MQPIGIALLLGALIFAIVFPRRWSAKSELHVVLGLIAVATTILVTLAGIALAFAPLVSP